MSMMTRENELEIEKNELEATINRKNEEILAQEHVIDMIEQQLLDKQYDSIIVVNSSEAQLEIVKLENTIKAMTKATNDALLIRREQNDIIQRQAIQATNDAARIEELEEELVKWKTMSGGEMLSRAYVKLED